MNAGNSNLPSSDERHQHSPSSDERHQHRVTSSSISVMGKPLIADRHQAIIYCHADGDFVWKAIIVTTAVIVMSGNHFRGTTGHRDERRHVPLVHLEGHHPAIFRHQQLTNTNCCHHLNNALVIIECIPLSSSDNTSTCHRLMFITIGLMSIDVYRYHSCRSRCHDDARNQSDSTLPTNSFSRL